jgi:hypothetical protein
MASTSPTEDLEEDALRWAFLLLSKGHVPKRSVSDDGAVISIKCSACGCNFYGLWLNVGWGEVPEPHKISPCPVPKENP